MTLRIAPVVTPRMTWKTETVSRMLPSLWNLSVRLAPATDGESLEVSILAGNVCAKAGYFAMCMGLSSSPYYGLLLESKGFTLFSVGAILAVMPLYTVLLLPPLSNLAVRYHCAMTIHLCSAVGSAIHFTVITLSNSKPIITFMMVLHYVYRILMDPFMGQRAMSIQPPDRKAQWDTMRSYGWAVGVLIPSALIG
ncbi:MFS transporter, PPP family, 3-phenylpropionic acid transporter [Trypanosoma grayi]|uniref:MFS transporter, PPP family, 3-phenylpropionic acid transporter n=1 Tax=Trypanosoma grayi TaxID=71804 RepID=UPI0004F3F2CB|nr:MFS transporter, PPP family, 3-phenylpropionic acid transporter [Trypanosoma grayi]KEG08871.1 MFS transporter, PPP family, 3-phenylpropionic acid transporter [Trypanosoma grayi]